jgi:hypothetical protein
MLKTLILAAALTIAASSVVDTPTLDANGTRHRAGEVSPPKAQADGVDRQWAVFRFRVTIPVDRIGPIIGT